MSPSNQSLPVVQTPAPLSDERLAEIAARAAAATSGTWHVLPGDAHKPDTLLAIRGDSEIAVGTFDFSYASNRHADRSFIIHARQDVPALLAEVDRRDKQQSALEDELTELREEYANAVKAIAEKNAQLAALEQQSNTVAEFVAKRAEYITSIRNCHPDNGHDYDRWQGHAEARRQLAEVLGLPIAWPAEAGEPA